MKIDKEIMGHNKRNKNLLKTLFEKGINLNEKRAVEHHFWVETQRHAAFLARELFSKGYLLLMLSPNNDDSKKQWNVEAGYQRSPSEAASEETTDELVRLASKFNATYDGWGTSV